MSFLFIHKNVGSKSLSRSHDDECRNLHRHVRLNRPATTPKVRQRNTPKKLVRLIPKRGLTKSTFEIGSASLPTTTTTTTTIETSPNGDGDDEVEEKIQVQRRQQRPQQQHDQQPTSSNDKKQLQSNSNAETPYFYKSHRINSTVTNDSTTSMIMMINGNSTDPFNISSIPIDKGVHHLLQYFLNVSHPRNWHAEARAYKGEYRFRHFARGRIVNCLKNESSMYALLASSASQMHYFEGITPPTNPSILIGKALRATRKRLSQTTTNDTTTASASPLTIDIDLIFDIHALANADFFRFDRQAARTHIRVVAQLIHQLGGLSSLDRAWREWFIFGDEFIAAEVFEKPFFQPDPYDPGSLLEAGLDDPRSVSHYVCEEDTILDNTEAFMNNPELRALAIDIVELAQETKWQAMVAARKDNKVEELPQERVRWRHLRAAALRSRLLHLDSADRDEEVTRLALLTWMYMVTTVVGRRRTMKVLASRLRLILKRTSGSRFGSSDGVAWNNDEFLLWTLLTAACASEGDRRLREWYWNSMSSLYKLRSNGQVLTASVVFGLISRFLYFPDVQRPMMEELLRENGFSSTT